MKKNMFFLILLSFALPSFARDTSWKDIPWEELTPSNYKSLIDGSNKPVVLYISSDTCLACKAMEEILYPIHKQFSHKYNFVRLNFKRYTPFSLDRYRVQYLPTFIFFLDGQEVGRDVGVMSKNKFKQRLNQLFE